MKTLKKLQELKELRKNSKDRLLEIHEGLQDINHVEEAHGSIAPSLHKLRMALTRERRELKEEMDILDNFMPVKKSGDTKKTLGDIIDNTITFMKYRKDTEFRYEFKTEKVAKLYGNSEITLKRGAK